MNKKDIDFFQMHSYLAISLHPVLVEREDYQGSTGKISYGDRGCVFKNAMFYSFSIIVLVRPMWSSLPVE